jgi:hypothetical protein
MDPDFFDPNEFINSFESIDKSVDNYNIQKFIKKWNMVFDYAINNFK